LLKDIIEKKTLDDDLKNRIKAALKEYKENYVAEHQEAKLMESSVKPLDGEEKKPEDEKKAAADQQQKEVAAKA
jgi:F-type H+-transporting ATPase subunit alpha